MKGPGEDPDYIEDQYLPLVGQSEGEWWDELEEEGR